MLSCLSSVLFPTGVNKAPIEQLQHFYRAAVGNAQTQQTAALQIEAAGGGGQDSEPGLILILAVGVTYDCGRSFSVCR